MPENHHHHYHHIPAELRLPQQNLDLANTYEPLINSCNKALRVLTEDSDRQKISDYLKLIEEGRRYALDGKDRPKPSLKRNLLPSINLLLRKARLPELKLSDFK